MLLSRTSDVLPFKAFELWNYFMNPSFLIGRQLRKAVGLDNLLYTPDADFSCFADLALTSPEDYYIEGQGSLLQ